MAQASSSADEATPLTKGDGVRAFYHMNDHPSGFRYVRVLSTPPEGTPESVAVVGLSTGWIPATVAEDWKPGTTAPDGDDRVLVKLHGQFADVYNLDPAPVKNMYWRVKRSLVRPMGGAQRSGQARLDLSLLVVRWWDYYNPKNRRSRTHNVANEDMITDILEGPHSPHETFGTTGGYEVITAFIRSSDHLEAINASVSQAMRGQHKAGLYFLWPTQRPFVERKQAGCVSEQGLFDAVRRMEGLGVKSCWPHDARLWRELSGKLWTPRVCKTRPELKVPPTVMVNLESWKAAPEQAVKDIISELRTMDGVRGSDDTYRGVVKLGFSWMGEDVLPFTGPTQMAQALTQLLDGASTDCVCLVQKRVENVACELRTICCRDLASGPQAMKMELARMEMRRPRHSDESFALTGHIAMTATEARDKCFKGDAKALQAAEKEVWRLTDLWLAYLREEGFDIQPSCRLDFMVAPSTTPGGTPEVWTVEVCENGGAIGGYKHHPRTAATLNSCLSSSSTDGATSSRPPQVLPAFELEPVSYSGSQAQWSQAPYSKGTVRPRTGPAGSSNVLARVFGGGLSAGKVVALLSFLALLWLRFSSRRR